MNLSPVESDRPALNKVILELKGIRSNYYTELTLPDSYFKEFLFAYLLFKSENVSIKMPKNNLFISFRCDGHTVGARLLFIDKGKLTSENTYN